MKDSTGSRTQCSVCSLASQAALAQTKIDTLKVQNLNEVIVKAYVPQRKLHTPWLTSEIRTQTILLLRSGIAISPFSYTGQILAWREKRIGTGTYLYAHSLGAAGSRTM